MSIGVSRFTSFPRRVPCSCPTHCLPQHAAGSDSKAFEFTRCSPSDSFSRRGSTPWIHSYSSDLPSSRSTCASWMNWSAKGKDSPSLRRGPATQLYNLRLYQPGDDSRAIHWMTTARTSQLIVRETEAEDQRRITVVLSLVAPDDHDPLFERSVTFVASLLWQLTDRAYPVRLIVGAEDSGLGAGSAHLLAMLRLLAICKRQPPEAGGMGIQSQQSPLTCNRERGYTVAVMPWSDQTAPSETVQADRVLHAAHLEELTHAF